MSQPDYAAVAVVNPVTGRWELMSSGGRVIVFDTAQMAWEWLPLLGQGRLYRADRRTLSLWFLEVSSALPNRARVVCPYRPEEAQPWRRHLIWSEWWSDCGQPKEPVPEEAGHFRAMEVQG
ncbi:MAG TPA: hypothetical protein VFB38_19540 [Chthonomonadaceae bacterium]|nr:hypothetical protein [Chthonomonadaceae bacterium]